MKYFLPSAVVCILQDYLSCPDGLLLFQCFTFRTWTHSIFYQCGHFPYPGPIFHPSLSTTDFIFPLARQTEHNVSHNLCFRRPETLHKSCPSLFLAVYKPPSRKIKIYITFMHYVISCPAGGHQVLSLNHWSRHMQKTITRVQSFNLRDPTVNYTNSCASSHALSFDSFHPLICSANTLTRWTVAYVLVSSFVTWPPSIYFIIL